jgi:hypothetical protein
MLVATISPGSMNKLPDGTIEDADNTSVAWVDRDWQIVKNIDQVKP